ncbi:MAG: hypothetical protein ACKOZY_12330, partial [Flavobacteriales bacterium]
MENKLTPFEELVKEKLSGQESAHQSKSWNGFQFGLNRRGSGGSSWIFAAVSAALVIGTAAGYWLHHKTQAVDSVASTEMTNPSMQTPEQDSNGTWKSANLDSPNQTILPIDVNPS